MSPWRTSHVFHAQDLPQWQRLHKVKIGELKTKEDNMPVNFHPSLMAKGAMFYIFYIGKDLNFLLSGIVTQAFNHNALEADTSRSL